MKMLKPVHIYKVIWLICTIIIENEGARILAVYPIQSISHQIVFRPLTQELINRGHEVVAVTPIPEFVIAPDNLIEIDIHEATEASWRETFETLAAQDTLTGRKQDFITTAKMRFNLSLSITDKLFQSNEIQTLISNQTEHFDLLLIEAICRSLLAFSYIYKVPVIQVSSYGSPVDTLEIMGSHVNPLIYPHLEHNRIYNLTFWEKVDEMYNHLWWNNEYNSLETVENEILQRYFGLDIPPINKLRNNIDMLFLNIHTIWSDNQPVPPGVILLSGLHLKPEKNLSLPLKSYLDASSNGVIYISFGTNIVPSKLPAEKIQLFVRVLSHLPYDVLFKWDQDELPGRTENIKISKWFQQADLLRHPKVKLFITQGGLQSTDEAINGGVPLIGIPMLGDQWYNVEKYVYYKIGMQLDMDTITEEVLSNAIDNIIKHESYRRNVVNLRSLMHDQQQKSLERAIWWTEHVLRHGRSSHLRAPAANMSWVEYLDLQFVLTLIINLITSAVVSFILIYLVLDFIVSACKNNFKSKII